MIQVLDKTFEVFIETEEIENEVAVIAEEINADYKGKELVLVVVLNGAFMFASDLMKRITIPAEITFVKLSSYRGTSTTGQCPGWSTRTRGAVDT